MIKIVEPKNIRGKVQTCVCQILLDSEADIDNMGEVVTDGHKTVRPEPDSWAYTADMSAMFHLSPSGVWTKTV